MYDEALKSLITSAFARLRSQLRSAGPSLARQTLAWMADVAGSSRLEACFTRPEAFPVLLLPWWLGKTLRRAPDAGFQADVLYSTINGCYYVRLIDNVMDEHEPADAARLPAAAFFHTQFQLIYQRYFEHDHPFWDVFAKEWLHSSETLTREAGLSSLGPRAFRRMAPRKFGGIRIPIAAVCFRNRRHDVIRPWWQFCDALSCLGQMMDDLFDWRADLSDHHHATYFLSEAARRKRGNESVTAWVVREGFHWGVAAVRDQLAVVRARSRTLESPDVERYLTRREALLLAQEETVREGLESLAALAPLLPA